VNCGEGYKEETKFVTRTTTYVRNNGTDSECPTYTSSVNVACKKCVDNCPVEYFFETRREYDVNAGQFGGYDYNIYVVIRSKDGRACTTDTDVTVSWDGWVRLGGSYESNSGTHFCSGRMNTVGDLTRKAGVSRAEKLIYENPCSEMTFEGDIGVR